MWSLIPFPLPAPQPCAPAHQSAAGSPSIITREEGPRGRRRACPGSLRNDGHSLGSTSLLCPPLLPAAFHPLLPPPCSLLHHGDVSPTLYLVCACPSGHVSPSQCTLTIFLQRPLPPSCPLLRIAVGGRGAAAERAAGTRGGRSGIARCSARTRSLLSNTMTRAPAISLARSLSRVNTHLSVSSNVRLSVFPPSFSPSPLSQSASESLKNMQQVS